MRKTILQGFRDRGLEVVEITTDTSNPAIGAASTAAAIADGVDVIYQGC